MLLFSMIIHREKQRRKKNEILEIICKHDLKKMYLV